MLWHIRFLFRFVKKVITGIPVTWEISGWSRYSKGHLRDQIEAVYMLWQDFLTARSFHQRVVKSQKKKHQPMFPRGGK